MTCTEIKCFKVRESKNKMWVRKIKECFVEWLKFQGSCFKKWGGGNLEQAEIVSPYLGWKWGEQRHQVLGRGHLLGAKYLLTISFLNVGSLDVCYDFK